MESKNHYRAVILSPHLDDAVFSCGGEIAKLRYEGKVLVINIFTKYLEDAKKAAVVLGAERYAEESGAAKTLDYEYKNLDELDAFFRLPIYRSIGNIFRPIGPVDLEYCKTLQQILFKELENLSFERVYVPLAIGWHVDHYLTFLAMQDFAAKNKVYFYEDAPYCFIDTATNSRLHQIQGKKESMLAFLKRWIRASISFYKSGMVQTMQPAWQRYFAFPVTSGYLLGMLKSHFATKRDIPTIDPQPVISDVSPYFEIKMQAANLYKSQVKEFFCNFDDMRKSYTKHSKTLVPDKEFVERYWKFKESK
ncbi:MAG: PIG-L family deacetylase [Candidatus Omnitrophica bacterium]|nr:PIG-L family deacetylase [Candidatus Omnitrophota bacterium]